MKLRSVFVAMVVATTSIVQITTAQTASAYPSANVQLAGHGFGHGRGLSQYGALGYATGAMSWQSILDHYYSNTVFGAPTPDFSIGVRMVENDGVDMIVTSQSNFTVGPVAYNASQAALVRRIGSNNFAIFKSNDCGGGGGWNQVTTAGGPVIATSSNGNPGNSLTGLLQLCSGGNSRGVRGTLQAVDDNGTQRAVNALAVEDYLRGVVPRESPASWGDLGGGSGMNALAAQAVAARSYVLSAGLYSYATTCDTTSCQVYGGAYLNGARIEDNRSDTAVSETAGIVRRLSGAVARTEFSSSSGGYTAGGTFPAVVDDGDSVAQNPNHNWTASVPVSSVEGAYPSIGSLQSISINSRNGLGDMGGRVLSMTLVGGSNSLTTTGDDFRVKLGLKSNWFQVQFQPSGGVNGYWQLASDGGVFTCGAAPFYGSMGGTRLNSAVVGLIATADSGGYWEVAGDGGLFAFGNAQFHGSMGGRPLNQPIVGMAPTPSGDGYWQIASDGGIFAFGGAQFYGSMGGRHLNRPIVAMASTATGHGYWLIASDGGVFAFGDAQFYGSTGNIALRRQVVAGAATANGGGYWMLAADGGVFAFGNAGFFGSLPGNNINASATSFAPTKTGNGYLIQSANGVVYPLGDAPQFGSTGNFRGSVIGIAPVG